MSVQHKDILPVAAPQASTPTPYPPFSGLHNFIAALLLCIASCYAFGYVVSSYKELGLWLDAPDSGTRAFVITVLMLVVTVVLFLAFAVLLLTTADPNCTIMLKDEAGEPLTKSDHSIMGGSIFIAIVGVILAWQWVQPETCAPGELQTIVHIPSIMTIPVTAQVAFPGSPSETLTFVLAGAELGIAHQNDTSSCRITYDLDHGLATLNSSDFSAQATFSSSEMHLALPSPHDEGRFVLEDSTRILDVSMFGGGESIVRVLNQRKERVCLARFDRNDGAETVRVALPLGIVLRAARSDVDSRMAAWGILRRSIVARVVDAFNFL